MVSYSMAGGSDGCIPELSGDGCTDPAELTPGLLARLGRAPGLSALRRRVGGICRSRSKLAFVGGLMAVVLFEVLLLWWVPVPVRLGWVSALSLGASLPAGLACLGVVERHSPLHVRLWLVAWLVAVSAAACGIAVMLAGGGVASPLGYAGWRVMLALSLPGVICAAGGLRIPERSRQLGVAVYATGDEDVAGIWQKVGNHLDHVHVDLVDATVNPSAAAVELGRLEDVRRCWPALPVCLHVMSRRPRSWVERTWKQVDWYLLPCDSRDDLTSLMAECRRRGKRVGIVWQQGFPVERMRRYLSQVDFVMVMGIARLGVSGQALSESSLEAAKVFSRLSSEHHFKLMFDGGVNVENAARIPGEYLVSASGVLASSVPKRSAEMLRWSPIPSTGDRRAA